MGPASAHAARRERGGSSVGAAAAAGVGARTDIAGGDPVRRLWSGCASVEPAGRERGRAADPANPAADRRRVAAAGAAAGGGDVWRRLWRAWAKFGPAIRED